MSTPAPAPARATSRSVPAACLCTRHGAALTLARAVLVSCCYAAVAAIDAPENATAAASPPPKGAVVAGPRPNSTAVAEGDDVLAAEGHEKPVVAATPAETGEILKVCTTGDYPPLTEYDPHTRKYSGLAPLVLRHFGRLRNYTVRFVGTTWNTLAEDLADGKCEVAAGGITRTAARAQRFGVSIPVLKNRKVPVFSKKNEELFKSLADIDQADVTILVNRGGTNQAFVEALVQGGELTKAHVTLLDSVEEVYACLQEYPTARLVMFTDSIAAEFKAAQKELSLSERGVDFEIPKEFDSQTYKVFLANNSTKVLDELDRFLLGARAIGSLEAWRREAFGAKYTIGATTCPQPMTLV